MSGKSGKAPPDPVAMESGKRIRELRESRHWNQSALAQRTGWDEDMPAAEQARNALSPSRIANYEQGTRRLGLEEAEVFAKIFDMPAAYFMSAISHEEARLLMAWRATNAEGTSVEKVAQLGSRRKRRG